MSGYCYLLLTSHFYDLTFYLDSTHDATLLQVCVGVFSPLNYFSLNLRAIFVCLFN